VPFWFYRIPAFGFPTRRFRAIVPKTTPPAHRRRSRSVAPCGLRFRQRPHIRLPYARDRLRPGERGVAWTPCASPFHAAFGRVASCHRAFRHAANTHVARLLSDHSRLGGGSCEDCDDILFVRFRSPSSKPKVANASASSARVAGILPANEKATSR